MKSVFLGLAFSNLIFVFATAGVGFLVDTHSRDYFVLHMRFGVFAGIFACMMQSATLTYFVATGKWMTELAHAHGLNSDLALPAAQRYKNKVFPVVIISVSAAVASVALGSAGINNIMPMWAHRVVGLLTVVVYLFGSVIEYHYISLNGALIDRLLGELPKGAETGE